MTRTLSVRVEVEVDDSTESVESVARRLSAVTSAMLERRPEVTKVVHAATVTRKR